MVKNNILLLLSGLLLFLVGCLPVLSAPSSSDFKPPNDRYLVSGVPFIPDDSSHCGPSTLAAVMTFQGRETTKEEVAVDVQRTDLRGALGPDMVIWAREKGMSATFAGSSPDEILTGLRNNKPVILLLESGFGPIHKGHFVVAVGYGPEGLVVNSGLVQQEILSWNVFLKDWRRMGNFTIFISGKASESAFETKETGTAASAPTALNNASESPSSPEVVNPARAPQALNLPTGVDLPEELAEIRPAGTAKKLPDEYLAARDEPNIITGADIPGPRPSTESPIVDLSGYPNLSENSGTESGGSSAKTSSNTPRDQNEALAAQRGGEAGDNVAETAEAADERDKKGQSKARKPKLTMVLEPLPLADDHPNETGFSQKDVGLPPLMLPVVPLPEEQPITGSRMGSDFTGPATVPGARTPSQMAQESRPKAAEQTSGKPSDKPAVNQEQEPVMEWER
ncbi:MAG: C39 family peptidase [Deltaproteobacteria bacterium]|jgi:hypothetical protein|nr:C39 family peptidase [Deltaproteobacteria bacterium]